MPAHRPDSASPDAPGPVPTQPHPDTVFDADWLSLRSAADTRARSAALTAVWDPWRSLRLTASLRRELRDSNDNAFDYKANGAFLAAQLTF